MRLLKQMTVMMAKLFRIMINSMGEALRSGNLSFIGKRIVGDIRLIAINMEQMAVRSSKTWDKMLVPEESVMASMRSRVEKGFKGLLSITEIQAEKIKKLLNQAMGGIFVDVVGTKGIPALEDLKKRLAEVLTGPVPPTPDLGTAGGISGDIATAGTFSARAVAGMAGMGVFNQQLNAQNQMVNLLSSIDQKTPDEPVAIAG